MGNLAASVLAVFDYAWDRLFGRLAGLSDDEYFWEPVTGCWSLRRDDQDQWRLDGGGGGGPAPDPAPVTTIAWRICHLGALALGGFTDRLFPDLAMQVRDLPSDADSAVGFLELNYQRWRQGLESLGPEAWWDPLGPAWGPYSEDSKLDLALHVLDELIHHGAEIGLMRDLYQHRAEPVGGWSYS